MKFIISTLLLLLIVSTGFAQGFYYAYPKYDSVITFETGSLQHDSITIDTRFVNNKWQIGKPQKATFDTAFNSARAIVTDTVNTCVPGDTSVFYLRLPYYSIVNAQQAMYGFFAGLGFIHRLDIDSGSIAKVEQLYVHVNGVDSMWVDVIDTPYTDRQWDYCDTPDLRYSTTGWDTVTVFLLPKTFNFYDSRLDSSVLFRFTYISNDTSLTKDGWMIDDIWPNYYFAGSVSNIKEDLISIYPNPSRGEFYIKHEKRVECKGITVVNMLGKIVLQMEGLPADGNLKLNLPDGIYSLQYFTNEGVDTEQILIQH